jgi:hypothetical protein
LLHASVIVSDEPKVPDAVGAQVGTGWEFGGGLVGDGQSSIWMPDAGTPRR